MPLSGLFSKPCSNQQAAPKTIDPASGTITPAGQLKRMSLKGALLPVSYVDGQNSRATHQPTQ